MSRVKLVLLLVLWGAVVGAGLLAIRQYETTPGKSAVVKSDWPAVSRIQLSGNQATLVMLAHPQCPCTRASMAQLARLLTELQNRVAAHVIFVIPEAVMAKGDTVAAHWRDTDLVNLALAIPGVTVSFDEGGIEAQRFGATTSGHVCLFTPSGKLAFEGGITDARGHEGDNAGQNAIVQIVNGRDPETTRTDVFGCGL